MPFVKPVTLQVNAPVVVQVFPPGLDVTVYLVMTAPPLSVGADHATVAEATPAVAVTLVGAPGKVDGFTAADAGDAAESAISLVAFTVKV